MKKLSIIFFLLVMGVLSINAQTGSYFGRNSGAVGPNQESLLRATALGYNAHVGVSDGLVLGDTLLVKVGIGTSYPQYRLDVKGIMNVSIAYSSPGIKINSRNFLELDQEGHFVLNPFKMKYSREDLWSDKVFDNNYSLMSLQDLQKYISQNKHLPGIPSAKEVVENGVPVDQMIAKLLEKIEELSLYSIQLKEEIEILKKNKKDK